MDKKKSAVSFEQGMSRLEEIVSSLEEGSVELETAMALFTEGAKLSAALETQLRDARLTVEKLFPEQKQG